MEIVVLHPAPVVYVTDAVPATASATNVPDDPDPDTVASPVPLQVPPAVASVNITVVPAHSAVRPSIDVGLAFTVTVVVTEQPADVYDIVAVPV